MSIENAGAPWCALVSGDPAATTALRRLVLRCVARPVAQCASLEVDDVVQDATARIMEKLHTYRGDAPFPSWAAAISVRVALSARRRIRYQHVTLEESALAGMNDIHASCERDAVVRSLRDAIETSLTTLQRQVVLAELGGLPSVAVAERLGMTRNAVYKVHHDARRKLKAALIARGVGREDVVEL